MKADTEASSADEARGCDLIWRAHRVSSLPYDEEAVSRHIVARRSETADGDVIDFLFGYEQAVHCHFRIFEDGSVTSWATERCSERDLFGLFSETILRAVFQRLRLPSFHASALIRDGRAFLIVGDKGAGKSTLSAALTQRGWELLADDLVRVADQGGWVAFPGACDGKLNPDSAGALGYAVRALPSRWTLEPSFPGVGNKLLVTRRTNPDEALNGVPIGAIFSLGPRHRDGAAIKTVAPSPIETVRELVRHATPDLLAPGAPPAPFLHHAIAGLARTVPVYRISLADRLDRALDAAGAVDAIAGRHCQSWQPDA